MNTKNLNFTMIFIFSSLLLSCGKSESDDDFVVPDYRVEDVLYPKDSKLKRVYNVSYNRKDFVREYLYDDLGRISRVNFGSADRYDIYQYNANGQVETISMYSGYLENTPVLFQTITHSYDADGNKVKELSEGEHLYLGGVQTWSNIFQYNDMKLAKKEYYEDDQLKYCIVYEYEGNILKKEKFLVPGSKDYVTTKHFYDQGLLVYSTQYNNEDSQSALIYDMRYYDWNNNLIKLVQNRPGLSSMSGATVFLIKWEYEYE